MAVVGEVRLFLKEKRCRNLSDYSAFGWQAQKYTAARLSAVVEHRGAILAVVLVCEA